MKAVVTGASSGIGRDIARVLAGRGYELILIARREERLRELAQELPVQTEVLPADLADRESCLALAARLQREDIDILVNNAGRGVFGPFASSELADELEMLDVNITALHILMKAVLPGMKKRGRGHILNVASAATFLPGPLLASYYASKAYVLRLSAAVAEELRRADCGVKISVLCPGPVRTEFDQVAKVRFSSPGRSSRQVAEYAVEKMLSGRQIIIPGSAARMVHIVRRLLPGGLLARCCWHVQHRKEGEEAERK